MEESVAILRALAAGFDPRTGEEFQEDGAWSDPKVIRALFRAAEALEGSGRGGAARGVRNLPPAAGKPWTPEEDERLKSEFRTITELRSLAELHARTTGAISARLVRWGLIDPPGRPAARPAAEGS
jgi:hypothetical protein